MAKDDVFKGFMVVCGSLEIMLFGGVIFGWASLVYIYKDEGYFRHLCQDGKNSTGHDGTSTWNISMANVSLGTNYSYNLSSDAETLGDADKLPCKEQDNQFNLIFSSATVFTGIMCFVNGLLYDRLGTRFCRIIGLVCFIGAMLCLIFASPEMPLLLYPGAILLTYGGYLILVTNLQLANLIPRFRSTIMSVYAGSYDCSAVMFLAFKEAHGAGIKVNTCFMVQACVFSIVLFSTFCTLPKLHLPWPLPEGFKVRPPIQRLCENSDPTPDDPQGEVKVTEDNEAKGKVGRNEKADINTEGKTDSTIPVHTQRTERLYAQRGSSARSRSSKGPSILPHNVSQLAQDELTSQEYLLAINHVPRLSTSSINMSVMKPSSSRTPRKSNMRRPDKYSPNHHHLSLLNIPQVRRTIATHDRPSVSLDNIPSKKTLDIPSQEAMLAINHVPRLSTSTLSIYQSSPIGSVFRSINSIGGVSDISRSLDEALDAMEVMGDNSAFGYKRTTFRKEVLSPLFLMDVVWMSLQRLRSWFFVGVFNPWITTMAAGDQEKISYYTSVFAVMQFFGFFTAPLSGRLMDRKPGEKYPYNNHKYERLHASIASFVLNSTVVLLLSISASIPILELQYVTFVLHVLNRSFIYGPNSAFVANAFPFEYFGLLLGTTLTLSAIFGMIQYPMFLIIQGPLNNDPLYVNIVLIVLMFVTYIHPAYIWIYLRRKLRKQTQMNESEEPLKKGDQGEEAEEGHDTKPTEVPENTEQGEPESQQETLNLNLNKHDERTQL